MNDYKPRPEWNEAVQRASQERKEVCDRLSEKFRVKKEKEKQERQKGRKK